MKRFLSALMALCLVLSLSACAVAEDAVRVDTSSLNFEESAAVLAGLVIDRLSPKQE